MNKLLLITSALVLTLGTTQPVWSMAEEGKTKTSAVKRKITKGKVATQAGDLFYRDSGGKGPVVLCIHGNSTSSRLFKGLMRENPDVRFIAFDSPGHGKSFRPSDKLAENIYSFPGCADAIIEGIDKLKVQKFSVLGISKGGHEAVNLYAAAPDRVESLMTSGTPYLPLFTTPEQMGAILGAAFKQTSAGALSGKAELFTPDEAILYIEANGLDSKDAKWIKTAQETDGRARALMFQSVLANQRVDEVKTVKRANIPVLCLGGQDDAFVDYEYVKGLGLPSHVELQIVKGEGHSFVWNNPKRFNQIMMGHLAKKKVIRSRL